MRVNRGVCNSCSNDSLEIVEVGNGDQAVECQSCKIQGESGYTSTNAINNAIDSKMMTPRDGRG